MDVIHPTSVKISNSDQLWLFIPDTKKSRPTFLSATTAARVSVSTEPNAIGAMSAPAVRRSKCGGHGTNASFNAESS
jgi:hypothetical protein